MNVILITHISPPAIDGGSKIIHQLGKYLQKHHRTLTLSSDCASTDDFTKTHRSVNQQLPVYTLFHRPLKILSRIFPTFFVFSKGPIFKIIPFIKSLYAIYRFQPDLIIAGPLPTTIIIYAYFIRLFTRSQLLICPCFHHTDPEFQNPILTKIILSADYLWTLTDFESNYLHSRLGVPLTKIITAGAAVTPQYLAQKHLSARNTDQNILFIGSFSAHKSLDTLLKSYSILHFTHPHLTLTLAGQPTLYSISPLSSPHVTIIAGPTDAQIINLIDRCTMLVLPSTQESFGLVLLETWARKKPVIVSNIPQLSEMIIKTHGGLTFRTNDSSDLAQKISQILDNQKLCSQLASSGFQYTKNHYTWDKIGEQLCQKLGFL